MDKDETAQDEIVSIGCHMANFPARVEPALDKLVLLFKGVFELCESRRASPLGIAAMIGVAQWFSLMARSFFSIFDEVYIFARLEPGKVIVDVPEAVITELIVFVLLSPLLVANLTREFDPLLVATDASSSFGFGASA